MMPVIRLKMELNRIKKIIETPRAILSRGTFRITDAEIDDNENILQVSHRKLILPNADEFFTRSEACAETGISDYMIGKWIKEKSIVSKKKGKYRWILKSSLYLQIDKVRKG
jgi:hypothetical protein